MSESSSCNAIRALRPDGTVMKNSSRTKIEVHKLRHVWTIDHYSFHHAKKSALQTSVFTSDTNRKCKWFMSLERDTGVEDEDVMGVFIKLHYSSECEQAFIKYKICILNNEREHRIRNDDQIRKLVPGGNGWGYKKFISSEHLSNETWFPNDTVTIALDATFSEVIETSEKSYLNSAQRLPFHPTRNIAKDLSDLLTTQEFTDVTVSVNGKDFRAHKLILAARSPVFAAMFKHDMKENESNVVEIVDTNEKVIEEMLRYIYTEQCENLKDLAIDLFIASHKYDLEGLNIACQEFLIDNLTVENAVETLNFAHLHSAAELKSKTIDFIVAKSSKVKNSSEWKKSAPLFPQSLMMEIIDAFCR